MRVKITHSDTEEKDRLATYAKQLLRRTLESHRPRIRSVTVNVSLSADIPFGEFYYHCAVQVCMTQGRKIKAEARDCDEVLAVYRAVDKVRDLMEHQARS